MVTTASTSARLRWNAAEHDFVPAVNALHGIRPVRRWVGTSIDAGPAHQARRWKPWLDCLAVPVLPDRVGTTGSLS